MAGDGLTVTPLVTPAANATTEGLSHADSVFLMRAEGFSYLALAAGISLVFLLSAVMNRTLTFQLQIRMPFVTKDTPYKNIKSYITRADGLIGVIFMYILSIQVARYSFTHVAADFARVCDVANIFVLLVFLRSFLSRTHKMTDNTVLFVRGLGLAAISATLYFNDLKEEGSLHGRIATGTGVALTVCTAVGIVVIGVSTFFQLAMADPVDKRGELRDKFLVTSLSGPAAPYLMISPIDVVYLTVVAILIFAMVLVGNLSGNNVWYTIAFFIPPVASFIAWTYTLVQSFMTKSIYNLWMQTCLTFALTVLAFTFYQQRGVGEMALESRFAMSFQVGTFTLTAFFWLLPIVWYDEMSVVKFAPDNMTEQEFRSLFIPGPSVQMDAKAV